MYKKNAEISIDGNIFSINDMHSLVKKWVYLKAVYTRKVLLFIIRTHDTT